MKFVNFKCPACQTVSKAGAWNVETLQECAKRKIKIFSKIQDCGNTSLYSYVCPACKKVSLKTHIIPMLQSNIDAVKEETE